MFTAPWFPVNWSLAYNSSQMRIAVQDPLQPSSRPSHVSSVRSLLASLLPICVSAIFFTCAVHLLPAQSTASKRLLIYSIDVEGGQSTLLISPTGASLLVDTGWPGYNGRDAERIRAAMKDAGIARIDDVFITHYHTDHVGGVPELVKRIPVGEFIDHGPNREDSDVTRRDFAAYLKAIGSTPRRSVRPGDTIQIPGLSVLVLAADGEHIASVPGIKPEPNSNCSTERQWPDDPSENARSAGILVTFGKFRFLDLGDLTGAKEVALVCPVNPIPSIDLYLVNHHGMNLSNSRALVNAIHPRVAIMNNGTHKAGSPEAWQTVHNSLGIEDLYMVHTAEGSDAAHNSTEALIANPKGSSMDGAYFKVVAQSNGSFSITNSRTGQTKEYALK